MLDECGENLPQVLLMENVPQVISKSNGNLDNFHMWRRKLEKLGYSNYVQLLNAKNYGIPQNRNRCFMVSILGDWHYSFPQKIELKRKLKDMLEEKVDERYYLSDKAIQGMLNTNYLSSSLDYKLQERAERSVREIIKERYVSKTVRVGGRGSTDRQHSWDVIKDI